nr:MAG TPA: hypothetical protein [Caudoviricetes sp.]
MTTFYFVKSKKIFHFICHCTKVLCHRFINSLPYYYIGIQKSLLLAWRLFW